MRSRTRQPVFRRRAFTLVEVVVVVAIIALLVCLIFPTLTAARELARSAVCLSNQRGAARAMLSWSANERNSYPSAYEMSADGAYATWAGQLVEAGFLPDAGARCPSFADGGLPSANPASGDAVAGQQAETAGVVDLAPRRCAYVPNEVVCPRPRFVSSGEASVRPSRPVRLGEVESDVILLAEYACDWRVLSGGDDVCRSYLPVHGLVGMGPMDGDKYDLNGVAEDDRPCFANGSYRRYRAMNLTMESVPNLTNPPRLNLVGRNHAPAGANGFCRSSFAFADGHAAGMTLPETLETPLWGHRVYSITGDQRIND